MDKKIFLILGIAIVISAAMTYYYLDRNGLVYRETIIIDEKLFQEAPRDPYTLKNVEIEGDFLKMELEYSGGCKEHEFKLIGTKNFMESEPVQIDVLLSHNANNDSCESLITEALRFDLEPLKEAWIEMYNSESGTMIIRILGKDETVTYSF